jgi:hypothetical protein
MGPAELMLVAIILLIVFGPLELPSLADRLREAQARRAHEPPRSTDWVFIGILAALLSFALAVAAVIFSGHG